MLFWLFTIAVVAIMAASIIGGVKKGIKYTWEYSLLRLINTVGSAVAALFLAKLAARPLGDLITNYVVPVLPRKLRASMVSADSIFGALFAMLLAPILFYLIFILIRGIVALIITPIAGAIYGARRKRMIRLAKTNKKYRRKLKREPVFYDADGHRRKKKRKERLIVNRKNPVGIICGALCSVCLLIVIIAPMTGLLNAANGVASVAGQTNKKVFVQVANVCDAAADNYGVRAVRYLGGDLLLAEMTKTTVNGRSTDLVREVRVLERVADAADAVTDARISRYDAGNMIREVGHAMSKAELIPIAAAEFIDGAAGEWAAGRTFCGIKTPVFVKNTKALMIDIYTALDGSTRETIKADVNTIANVVALLIEKGTLNEIKAAPTMLFSDTVMAERVMYEILSNHRLSVSVSGAADFGISVLARKLGVRANMNGIYEEYKSDIYAITPLENTEDDALIKAKIAEFDAVFDKYAIEVGDGLAEGAAFESANGTDMVEWLRGCGMPDSDEGFAAMSRLMTADRLKCDDSTVSDPREESVELATGLSVISNLAASNASELDALQVLVDLGPALDAFAASDTIGPELTADILLAVMQSEKIADSLKLSRLEATEVAKTVSEGAAVEGYKAQMLTLAKTFELLREASETGNATAAILTLLQDLTPESADTIRSITTADMMLQNGVPIQSAEPAADLMAKMFENLSNAKESGATDEEIQAENSAVTHITNTAMNLTKGSGAIFGYGSATGVSAEQYVNDIVYSDVISKTVVDEVYGNGIDPTIDPLNTQKELSDNDKTTLVNALNNTWYGATAEEREDEEFCRKLVAIGALMNVEVEVGQYGVELAE